LAPAGMGRRFGPDFDGFSNHVNYPVIYAFQN